MDGISYGDAVVVVMSVDDSEEIEYAIKSYLGRGGSGYESRDECLDTLHHALRKERGKREALAETGR